MTSRSSVGGAAVVLQIFVASTVVAETSRMLPGAVKGVSANGRYVLFASAVTDLVSDDTNGFVDVFVRDRLAGTTVRVNVSTSGAQANDWTYWATLSDDGRYVAFVTNASTLVADDTNAVEDVFVHDTTTGETQRVSVTSAGEQGNGPSGRYAEVGSRSIGISGDGRFVCFPTYATNLDPNAVSYCIHDRFDGVTRPIRSCRGSGLCPSYSVPANAAISGDGRWIACGMRYNAPGRAVYEDVVLCDAWTGEDVLVATRIGAAPQTSDLSLSTDGRYLAFVRSQAMVFDRSTGETTVASLDESGQPAPLWVSHAALSPDGRFLLFTAVTSTQVTDEVVMRRDRFAGTTESLRAHGRPYDVRGLSASSGASTIVLNTDAALDPDDLDTGSDGYVVDAVTIGRVLPVSGSELGGDVVHVAGFGFPGASGLSVRFGGADAQVLEVDATRARVLVPRGTGTVDVSVSTLWESATLAGAYTYVAPELAARYGNVNTGLGDREDVMLLNATAGAPLERTIDLAARSPITLVVVPPSSRATARYVVYGWPDLPSAATTSLLSELIGAIVFPTPFTGGAPQPAAIWNLLGHRRTLGAPTLASRPAPAILLSRPRGARAGARFTLQGLIEDDASPSGLGLSVTNALLVRVP
jgi:IPT/TIG domain-containing protein